MCTSTWSSEASVYFKTVLPVLWSDCGLCMMGWLPGDWPGLAGEGRGILGDPGQLDAAGDAIL